MPNYRIARSQIGLQLIRRNLVVAVRKRLGLHLGDVQPSGVYPHNVLPIPRAKDSNPAFYLHASKPQ